MTMHLLKMKKTIRRAIAIAAGASALLVTGAAQAALQDRDLDGDSVVDAFYDTDLDITWLRDADVNGPTTIAPAVEWANSFSFAGYDDWRLPTSDNCSGYNCTGSEMGHLWYVELGNSAGAMTNTSSFQNLQSYIYWSIAEDPQVPYPSRTFSPETATRVESMNSACCLLWLCARAMFPQCPSRRLLRCCALA